MAWTTPKTWTATVVTVADLNTHIRDNENILKTSITNAGDINAPNAATFNSSVQIVGGLSATSSFSILGDCLPRLRGYSEALQTVTPVAGVATIDLAGNNHVILILNANISSFSLSNSQFGLPTGYVNPIILYIQNDGTLRTITWTVNTVAVRFSSGVAPTLTGTLNKYDIVVLTYINTNIFGQQVGVNM